MQKTRPTRWPTTFAIIVLLFSALFCVWGGMSLFATRGIPVLYWSIAPNIYAAIFIGTVLGVSLIALMIVRIFLKFQIVLFVFAVVFSCLGLFAFYQGSMAHQDSIVFNGHLYHLALRDDAQWSDYILCECDSSGILCQCHALYSRYLLERPVSNTLSVNNATNEIYVKAGNDVIYIDGATQQCFPINGVCLDK